MRPAGFQHRNGFDGLWCITCNIQPPSHRLGWTDCRGLTAELNRSSGACTSPPCRRAESAPVLAALAGSDTDLQTPKLTCPGSPTRTADSSGTGSAAARFLVLRALRVL